MLSYLGRGVPQDPVEAWKWMLLALQGKDSRAQELAPTLVHKLTPEQRLTAERLTESFKPHTARVDTPNPNEAADASESAQTAADDAAQ